MLLQVLCPLHPLNPNKYYGALHACRPGSKAAKAAAAAAGTTADWVQKGPRMNATSSLLAAAVSSDGRFLAVGGGDKMVHVFEAGSGSHVHVGSALAVSFT